MKLPTFITDAKKAVVAATSFDALAVGLGIFDSQTAGVITAVLGAITTVLVYMARNTNMPDDGVAVVPKPPPRHYAA